MTYEEFMALPVESSKHYELVEGELFVNPAPNFRHQYVIGVIHSALAAYMEERGDGLAMMSPIDVVLSPETVLQPDVAVFFGDPSAIVEWKHAAVPPDIAVEVLSEGSHRHDMVTKRRLYMQHGVKEYWIADPENRSVTVVRGGEEITAAETITTPLLPRFALALRKVFP